MKKLKCVEDNLFGSEQIICSAKQSSRLLFWAIKHFAIFLVVMGLPIGLFTILPFVPSEWKEFLSNNAYIYYIYAGIAGLWLLIYIIKLLINISALAPYQIVLTTKRVILLRKNTLTTILLDSITGAAMNTKVDKDSKKAVYIEIQTASNIYKLNKMKNGNKLISMLTDIMLGGVIKITTVEDKTETDKKEMPKVNNEDVKDESIKETSVIKIKPNVKIDKIPKTDLDATDKLINKNETKLNTNNVGNLENNKKGD